MSRMQPRLRLYILSVIAATVGLTVAALALAPSQLTRTSLILAVLLTSVTALTYLMPIRLAPKRRLIFDASLHTVTLAAFLPGVAAVIVATSICLADLYRRRPWFNTLFNAAQVAISALAAGSLYRALVTWVVPDGWGWSAVALFGAGALLYAVSALAVECAAAIQRHSLPFANWRAVHGSSFLTHMALVLAGSATASTILRQPGLVLVALAPITLARQAMQASQDLDAESRRMVEQLADALDVRHSPHPGRGRRIAELAQRVARVQGLPERDSDRIYLAARLQDLSTLLPSEAGGEGRERHGERTAAAYAARMVRQPHIAEAIRHRHAAYDGRGAPGPSGKDLPLDARILAVATAWVELTDGLAYRPALSQSQARAVLSAGGGHQWDPDLVSILIGVLDAAPEAQHVTAPALAPAATVA